jgi:hypothetical protein
MTPIQTFGATQAPSNMMFPTAAYLQASQNAAEMQARGMSALGQGLASGITAAAQAYGDYKKMQSGIKASEKAYDTFKDFLDPQVRSSIDQKIEGINKDTSLSMQDKAAFWDQAKGFIGGSINQTYALDKQQKMINALAARQAAEARRPAPITGGSFGEVRGVDDYMNLPTNSSQGNPAPLQSTQQQGSPMISADGSSVYDPIKGRWVRLDNNARTGEIVPDNYYDNTDNLMFDPVTRRIIQQ